MFGWLDAGGFFFGFVLWYVYNSDLIIFCFVQFQIQLSLAITFFVSFFNNNNNNIESNNFFYIIMACENIVWKCWCHRRWRRCWR